MIGYILNSCKSFRFKIEYICSVILMGTLIGGGLLLALSDHLMLTGVFIGFPLVMVALLYISILPFLIIRNTVNNPCPYCNEKISYLYSLIKTPSKKSGIKTKFNCPRCDGVLYFWHKRFVKPETKNKGK